MAADPKLSDLGGRIRALRTEAGLTVRDLADHLHVSPATVSAIENGRTGISAVRIAEVAALLNTPVDTLLNPAGAAPAVRVRADDSDHAQDWRRFEPLVLEQPLRAALEHFSEVGYHATTMRELADRANMSVPGIYHYYSGKEQLLAALLDLTLDDVLDRCGRAIAAGGSSVERFTNLVECMALFHAHRAKLGIVAAGEARGLTGEAAERVRTRGRAVQHLFKAQVLQGCASGAFGTQNPEEAALAVQDMCVGLARWFTEGGRLNAEQIAAQYAEFALNLVECRR
ncbi:TetR family transcriptional regulator [Mycolicibacterium tokaiense]|uniref:Transcriptional regulator n=1 Tax=Mycolicibacterium tokaiense TaxID=39695 RepID=A0A378TNE3_9MYCO|nr:TetR family transcriptional regulator [Mycolicibacterium tokaiense]STZ62150.1 transcriptional regulator [Mycolicibacterium tokaiense]